MSLFDLPQSVMFLLFLSLFVLVGIYPVWQRLSVKIRKTLKAQYESGVPVEDGGNSFEYDQEALFVDPLITTPLNDYEVFVLRRLAQSDGVALSRKKITADLFLGPVNIKSALDSLLKRGMLHIGISYLLGIRFSLSERGRNYALGQGFVVSMRQ